MKIVIGLCCVVLLGGLAGCGSPEQRAQNHVANGETLLAKGELAKAGVEFRNAIKLKKDFVPAWRGLVTVEERRANIQEASVALRSLVEYDPTNKEARLKLSRVFLTAGATDEALTQLSAFGGHDEPVDAIATRAAVLLASKDTEAAEREARRALDKDPRSFDASAVLAAVAMTRGDTSAALRHLEQANIGPENENSETALRLEIFRRAGDVVGVEAELKKIIERDPKNTAVRRYLISLYAALGRLLDAERELRAATAVQPANLEAALDLVRFIRAQKGAQAARDELRNLAVASGNEFGFQLAAAELEFQLGEQPKAVQEVNKLLIAPGVQPDQKARGRLALARMHAARRDYASAETVLSEILKEDRRNVDALELRATVQMERANLQGATTDLRQALNERPGSATLMGLLGVALERSGAIELSEKQYADAMRASNFEPAHVLRYAAFLGRRGSRERAEEVLAEAAQRHPRDASVLVAMAQTKLSRQDWSAALQLANTIKGTGDPSGIGDQIRGRALVGQGKLNEAVDALNASIRAAPGSYGPVKALVEAYLVGGKPQEAEVLLKGQLSAQPSDANLQILMSAVRLALKDREGALQSIKAAIAIQPENPVGYRALAEFHLRERQTDPALQAIDAGLAKQPESSDLRGLRASVLELAGRVDEAIAEYERVIRMEPGSLVAANNLANLLADNREDKASLERASELAAVLRKSGIAQFKDTVGWLNVRKGDHQSGIPLLEEAAQALPANALIRYHLGVAYSKVGNPERAREQLKKATELEPENSALRRKATQALKEAEG
jgi:cellulose synthase operon protein C